MAWDAVILGAGPAGTSCAYHLAQAGAKVLVLEKQVLPGGKPCAGAIDSLAYSLAKEEVEANQQNEVKRLKLSYKSGLSKVHNFGNAIFRLIDRKEFDQGLLQRAQRAGAEFRGSSATEVTSEDKVKFANLQERATFIVDASGAGSHVSRRIGVKTFPLATLSADVPYDSATLSRYQDLAVIDIAADGWGYSWIFPKRGYLSIGAGAPRGVNLRQMLQGMLLREGLSTDASLKGYRLPIILPGSPLRHNHILVTGDAAGLADPLTGAGISWGMLSGKLAAQAIIEGKAEIYPQLITTEIISQLKVASKMLSLISFLFRLRLLPNSRRLTRLMISVSDGSLSYSQLARRLGLVYFLLRPKVK